jgi:hypothetical protein
MFLLFAALIIYTVLLVAVCGYALLRGGQVERAVALIFIAAVIGTQLASVAHFRAPEYGIMAVDAAHFVALMVVIYYSNRIWPQCAAAAQLVATITHIGRSLSPSMAVEAYLSIQPFWAFPILAALGWGTFSRHRTAH